LTRFDRDAMRGLWWLPLAGAVVDVSVLNALVLVAAVATRTTRLLASPVAGHGNSQFS
jgi:hypothetical protein